MLLTVSLANDYPWLTLVLGAIGLVKVAGFVLGFSRVLLQTFIVPGKSVRSTQAVPASQLTLCDHKAEEVRSKDRGMGWSVISSTLSRPRGI